jgi:hypothetical protein
MVQQSNASSNRGGENVHTSELRMEKLSSLNVLNMCFEKKHDTKPVQHLTHENLSKTAPKSAFHKLKHTHLHTGTLWLNAKSSPKPYALEEI